MGDEKRDGSAGEKIDTDRLLTKIYDALHLLARRRMARERPDHTLQPTALVNEVYVRLAEDGSTHWTDRRHFFGAAAEAMRRILIEYARAKQTAKRGGGQGAVPIEEHPGALVIQHGLSDAELLDLHDSLDALESESPDHALVVKLKFFVGMTIDEIAEAVGTSAATVNRRWLTARTWLLSQMNGGAGPA